MIQNQKTSLPESKAESMVNKFKDHIMPSATQPNFMPKQSLEPTNKSKEQRINIFNCKDEVRDGVAGSSMLMNYEFSTPHCHKIEDYHIG